MPFNQLFSNRPRRTAKMRKAKIRKSPRRLLMCCRRRRKHQFHFRSNGARALYGRPASIKRGNLVFGERRKRPDAARRSASGV